MTQTPKIYHLELFWQRKYRTLGLLFSVLGLTQLIIIGLLAPLLSHVYLEIGSFSVALLFVSLLIGNYIIRFADNASLIISDAGIEYKAPGSSLFAEWKDVNDVIPTRFGFWNVEGINFRKPPIMNKNLLSGLASSIGAKENIPLTPFVQDWRETELGQYVSGDIAAGDKFRVKNAVDRVKQENRDQNEVLTQKRLALVKRSQRIALIFFGLLVCIVAIWSFYIQMQK